MSTKSYDTALRTVLGYWLYISLVNLREECGWADIERVVGETNLFV